MTQKKKALGRGLDAILVDNREQTDADGGITMVRISDVEPNTDQPRKAFDSSELETLSESIAQYGMIQPITVRMIDGMYQIITGERRWRAARMAGLSEIPVIVISADDKKAAELDALPQKNHIILLALGPYSSLSVERTTKVLVCETPPTHFISFTSFSSPLLPSVHIFSRKSASPVI